MKKTEKQNQTSFNYIFSCVGWRSHVKYSTANKSAHSMIRHFIYRVLETKSLIFLCKTRWWPSLYFVRLNVDCLQRAYCMTDNHQSFIEV